MQERINYRDFIPARKRGPSIAHTLANFAISAALFNVGLKFTEGLTRGVSVRAGKALLNFMFHSSGKSSFAKRLLTSFMKGARISENELTLLAQRQFVGFGPKLDALRSKIASFVAGKSVAGEGRYPTVSYVIRNIIRGSLPHSANAKLESIGERISKYRDTYIKYVQSKHELQGVKKLNYFLHNRFKPQVMAGGMIHYLQEVSPTIVPFYVVNKMTGLFLDRHLTEDKKFGNGPIEQLKDFTRFTLSYIPFDLGIRTLMPIAVRGLIFAGKGAHRFAHTMADRIGIDYRRMKEMGILHAYKALKWGTGFMMRLQHSLIDTSRYIAERYGKRQYTGTGGFVRRVLYNMKRTTISTLRNLDPRNLRSNINNVRQIYKAFETSWRANKGVFETWLRRRGNTPLALREYLKLIEAVGADKLDTPSDIASLLLMLQKHRLAMQYGMRSNVERFLGTEGFRARISTRGYVRKQHREILRSIIIKSKEFMKGDKTFEALLKDEVEFAKSLLQRKTQIFDLPGIYKIGDEIIDFRMFKEAAYDMVKRTFDFSVKLMPGQLGKLVISSLLYPVELTVARYFERSPFKSWIPRKGVMLPIGFPIEAQVKGGLREYMAGGKTLTNGRILYEQGDENYKFLFVNNKLWLRYTDTQGYNRLTPIMPEITWDLIPERNPYAFSASKSVYLQFLSNGYDSLTKWKDLDNIRRFIPKRGIYKYVYKVAKKLEAFIGQDNIFSNILEQYSRQVNFVNSPYALFNILASASRPVHKAGEVAFPERIMRPIKYVKDVLRDRTTADLIHRGIRGTWDAGLAHFVEVVSRGESKDGKRFIELMKDVAFFERGGAKITVEDLFGLRDPFFLRKHPRRVKKVTDTLLDFFENMSKTDVDTAFKNSLMDLRDILDEFKRFLTNNNYTEAARLMSKGFKQIGNAQLNVTEAMLKIFLDANTAGLESSRVAGSVLNEMLERIMKGGCSLTKDQQRFFWGVSKLHDLGIGRMSGARRIDLTTLTDDYINVFSYKLNPDERMKAAQKFVERFLDDSFLTGEDRWRLWKDFLANVTSELKYTDDVFTQNVLGLVRMPKYLLLTKKIEDMTGYESSLYQYLTKLDDYVAPPDKVLPEVEPFSFEWMNDMQKMLVLETIGTHNVEGILTSQDLVKGVQQLNDLKSAFDEILLSKVSAERLAVNNRLLNVVKEIDIPFLYRRKLLKDMHSELISPRALSALTNKVAMFLEQKIWEKSGTQKLTKVLGEKLTTKLRDEHIPRFTQALRESAYVTERMLNSIIGVDNPTLYYSPPGLGTFMGFFISNRLSNVGSELLGLGIDHSKYYNFRDVLFRGWFMKRILPMVGIYYSYQAIDHLFDTLDVPPFDEGLTSYMADRVAMARLGLAKIHDTLGITDVLSHLEGLMPGFVESPLAHFARSPLVLPYVARTVATSSLVPYLGPMAPMGAATLGFAVSAFTGFGLPDLTKDYEKVKAEYMGIDWVPVKRGRFWFLGGSPFFGSGRVYYVPNWYNRIKAKLSDSILRYSSASKANPLIAFASSILDPYDIEKTHYFSRPYILSSVPFYDFPWVGSLMSATVGQVFKQEKTMHQDELSLIGANITAGATSMQTGGGATLRQALEYNTNLLTDHYDEDLTTNPAYLAQYQTAGLPGDIMPTSPFSLKQAFSQTLYRTTVEAPGLLGFLTETFLYGGKIPFMNPIEIASAKEITAPSRILWQMNAGEVFTEFLRRFQPRPRTDVIKYNPIPNVVVPRWLPDYLKRGDPYAKQYMEHLLPPGYELVYPYVRHTFPAEEEMLGRSLEETVARMLGQYLPNKLEYISEYGIGKRAKEYILENLQIYGLAAGSKLIYDAQINASTVLDTVLKTKRGGVPTEIRVYPAEFIAKMTGPLSHDVQDINFALVAAGKPEGMIMYVAYDNPSLFKIFSVKASRSLYTATANNILMARGLAQRALAMGVVPTTWGYSYSHIDRLRILSQVAPTSDEYKNEYNMVMQQIRAGLLPKEAVDEVEEIVYERNARLLRFELYPHRFYNPDIAPWHYPHHLNLNQNIRPAEAYTLPERAIGAAWEWILSMDTPIHTRFLHYPTPLEEYLRREEYGPRIRTFNDVWKDYIVPGFWLRTHSTRIRSSFVKGWLTGTALGGDIGASVFATTYTASAIANKLKFYLTGEHEAVPGIEAKRESIDEQFDRATYLGYRMLAKASGSPFFNKQARRTLTGLALMDDINEFQLISAAPYSEKPYIRGFAAIDNETTRRAILQHVSPLMQMNLTKLWGMGGYNPITVMNSEPLDDIEQSAMALEALDYLDAEKMKVAQREGVDLYEFGLGYASQRLYAAYNRYMQPPFGTAAAADYMRKFNVFTQTGTNPLKLDVRALSSKIKAALSGLGLSISIYIDPSVKTNQLVIIIK